MAGDVACSYLTKDSLAEGGIENRAASGALKKGTIVGATFKTATFPANRLSPRQSTPINVRPTRTDVAIARTIARNTSPALEEVAERATGLRRPGKRNAPDLAQPRKPHAVRFKDDGFVPIIRDGS